MGVILMVVGVAGLVITLVLIGTARRTGAVEQTARGDFMEPPQPDDPRI